MLTYRDVVSFFVNLRLAFSIKEWYYYDNKIGEFYNE